MDIFLIKLVTIDYFNGDPVMFMSMFVKKSSARLLPYLEALEHASDIK